MPSKGGLYEDLIPRETDVRLAYALRLVAQRCLYGVDKNPLAVEMAKLSLWLLTLAKDKPFEFLDHAIRCGDSLVGISHLDQLKHFNLDPSQGRNLFLRSVANRILPAQTTIADGTSLPSGVGVINRTNSAGQVIAVNTVREFSIVSGTSSVQNPFAEIDDKTSGGHDSYKALQMSLARRFSTGLTLNSQYTFSRSFGNTSGSNEARTAANNARALNEFDYEGVQIRVAQPAGVPVTRRIDLRLDQH